MGGRNRNKKAQAILLGPHNNTYQQQRYAARAQPRQRQRQQQRTRNRQQQFPHPEAYYMQKRPNEDQHYPKREAYQKHQQSSTEQIHQSQHSFQAHESYQEQRSYEVQHSYHEQFVVQQQADHAYPSSQTGQVHGTHQSYHTQQTYYVQQCYYSQDTADPHKIYQSQHTLKGSRQLHLNAGCSEAYSKGQKFSRQYNHTVSKRLPHQSHDAPTRLDSKASTAATAGGNGNGTDFSELPWSWCAERDVTNNKKYLDKHKGGEGLVFQRQAEAPDEKPKPKPDELDIWVNVGTVPPHIWGGRGEEDPQNAKDDEEEINGWTLRLFEDENAQSQAHSLPIIRSRC
ncbi:hypothetical protein Esti_001014 [Eimeria stiedai]